MYWANQAAQLRWLLAALLLSVAMLLGRFGVGTYSPAALALVAIAILCCAWALCSRPASISPAPPSAGRRLGFAFTVIFLLYIGWAVATLRWTPPQRVDVYQFQRDAAAALLRGVNPYSITHPDLYGGEASFFYGPGVVSGGRVHIGCPYPPLSLLAIVPACLAGDLRYTYVVALLLSAGLLLRLSASRFTVVAAALLLLNPVTLYVLSRGWTEPLVLLALCWTCAAAARRSGWLPVALGVFFASKQYSVLAVPLAGLLLPRFTWKAYVRLLAQAALVAGLLTLPLALWNWSDFWRDAVKFQVIQPFRPDALSFSVLAARFGLPRISQLLVAVAVAGVTVWSLLRAPRHPAGFAGCFALVMLVFFSLNKQAFVNYYFLVIGAALVAAISADFCWAVTADKAAVSAISSG